MSTQLTAVHNHIDKHFDASLERLKALLRIPSISTDPAYKTQTRQAGQWVVDQLAEIGFEASLRETAGHPMVIARHAGASDDAPHVLYYGHYDVQPPDPLELWTSDPFEPQIIDGPRGTRIVARGAVDDKGQLMTFIEAFRAWKSVHGELPINVTVMIEGEEESGSPSLDAFLKANSDELAADVCVVCDTAMWDIDTPAITYMLRGLVYIEATLHGPGHDLHSGVYGGSLRNPINALGRIVGELVGDDGRIAIPGFYDDVIDLTPEERAQWKALGFNEKSFLGDIGVTTAFGETGWSTLERTWARPTCDVNGIKGGYIGEGAKTVIGSHATAKISCRLVADMDPDRVHDALIGFLKARTPEGYRWSFKSFGRAPAIRVPTESPFLEAAKAGLEQTYGKPAFLIGSGGSIPVVGSIREILGYDSLLVGFGLEDDRMHSPNEKFEVKCYHMGIRSHASIMHRFASISRGVVAPS